MNENPSPFPSPAPQPRQGLSVTSLVLGILGLVACGFFTGIPAVITGHMARGRAKRMPDQFGGAGLALAGLVLGYVATVFTTVAIVAIGAAVALPLLAKQKAVAQSISCMNNMKQIGLAARMWSSDHNQMLPPDFASMSNEIASPMILVCAQDGSKTRAASWSEFSPMENVSYEFLAPNVKESEVVNLPVFQCPIHGHVGMGDGSVQGGSRRR